LLSRCTKVAWGGQWSGHVAGLEKSISKTVSGTHRQAVLGLAPTHRSCAVDEIVIFRVTDGKIVEAWEVYDEAGMWRQLGGLPPEYRQ
jgi:predicted ester cyclase